MASASITKGMIMAFKFDFMRNAQYTSARFVSFSTGKDYQL
jgi:hypothetical protein